MNIIEKVYQWAWTHFGKRPWTFIYRDIWHKYEWFPQMQWLFTGAIIYKIWGWKGLLVFVTVYTYGYLNGHFFWGKKYIPGQTADRRKSENNPDRRSR